MRKLYMLIACCLACLITSAQTDNDGFISDSTSYIVLSQPNDFTKKAQFVSGNIIRYPFLMNDNTLFLLSDDEVGETHVFALPDGVIKKEDAFILDSLIVYKEAEFIKSSLGNSVDTIIKMPDGNFDIYPADAGLFYLVKHYADSSSVFIVEAATGKRLKLFGTPFNINNLVGNGYECFITHDEIIYYVSDKLFSVVDVADSKIQSIDFYEGGVFYSTEKACYFLGLPGKSYPFLLGDIKQLMLVDNRLYLLFSDGLLSVIDNADGYRLLFDEVVNEK